MPLVVQTKETELVPEPTGRRDHKQNQRHRQHRLDVEEQAAQCQHDPQYHPGFAELRVLLQVQVASAAQFCDHPLINATQLRLPSAATQ